MSIEDEIRKLNEEWRNAIARDDLRDEHREKRGAATANATRGRQIKVEFYYGKLVEVNNRARRANTEQVAVVAICPLCSGYLLGLDRFDTRIEITNAVIAAIYAKWQTEIKLKPNRKPRLIDRPRAMRRTSLNQRAGSYAVFDVTISEGTLEDWKDERPANLAAQNGLVSKRFFFGTSFGVVS